MKPFGALILIFSILLCVACEARKEPTAEEYWKSIMKEEAMPEAIMRLYGTDENMAAKRGRFVKDFDVSPNVIIYHSHGRHSHGDASRDREDGKE